MSRLLAIEWDASEARLAVASTSVGGITVEQAFAVALPPRTQAGTAEGAAGSAIAAALAARHVGRVRALVAVGRASIELKQLSLPPSPDVELPDLVRFQAQREFNSLADDWPLDYLPLSGNADEPRQVLAAAIAPELVGQIQQTCAQAGLKPQRMVLRPCAAASLLCRQPTAPTERVRLLVEVLVEEADLTVLDGDQVVFLRTARVSAETLTGADEFRPLVGEIRRTIAAIQNQLAGERVQVIHLCGTGPDHAVLAQRIEAELGLPTRLFDPFLGVDVGRELRTVGPEYSGRYAPLLGMLLDEAAGTAPRIDFLNPRRRPPPPDRRRKYVWGAVGAVAAAVLVGLWISSRLTSLDEQIEDLTQESKDADKLVTKAKELERTVGEIDEWAKSDLVWLDELERLAVSLPKSEETMLTQVRMGPHADGGEIQLDGLTRSIATVSELEKSLRDHRHRVEGKSRQQDDTQSPYAWRFSSTVVVGRADADAASDSKSPAVVEVAGKDAPSGRGDAGTRGRGDDGETAPGEPAPGKDSQSGRGDAETRRRGDDGETAQGEPAPGEPAPGKDPQSVPADANAGKNPAEPKAGSATAVESPPAPSGDKSAAAPLPGERT